MTLANKTLFKVPQKAAIRRGGKYLVVKRSLTESNWPGHWDFPGGKLEHGEKPYKSLEREVKEETGLRVKAEKPVFAHSELSWDKKSYVAFFVYQCRLLGGKIKLSEEHTDSKWAARSEILKMKTENYLRAYMKSLGKP